VIPEATEAEIKKAYYVKVPTLSPRLYPLRWIFPLIPVAGVVAGEAGPSRQEPQWPPRGGEVPGKCSLCSALPRCCFPATI
jgi:hypothetical protein